MKNVWGPRQGDFKPCLGGNMTVSVHFRQRSRFETQIQDGCWRPFSCISSRERGQNKSGIYDWYGLFWITFSIRRKISSSSSSFVPKPCAVLLVHGTTDDKKDQWLSITMVCHLLASYIKYNQKFYQTRMQFSVTLRWQAHIDFLL